MSRLLYLDASAGASGDMILGALVDAGASLRAVRTALARMPVRGFAISTRRVERRGLSARHLVVRADDDVTQRRYADVARIVRAGRYARAVERRALAVFRRLYEAEAEVHGVPVDRVHLHEAGALDAIVDIVGATLALEALSPVRIVVSPITTGSGSVRCAHGLYPVPTPATALLLRGVPVSADDAPGERLTPTGAAILTGIADAWGSLPPMTIERVGYGAGSCDFEDRPNVLRAFLGTDRASPASPSATVTILECQIDDAPPQELAHAAERLLEAGALDTYVTPIVMKKGRSGHLLTAVVRPAEEVRFAAQILRDTPTLGVRLRHEDRFELPREIVEVDTRFGPIRVKVARVSRAVARGWPEHDDCAAAARRHAVTLAEVRDTALVAWRRARRRT